TRLSQNAVRILEASRSLEAMRRVATRMTTAPDAALIKEYSDNVANVETLIKKTLEQTQNPDRMALYKDVLAELDRHKGTFDQLIKSSLGTMENRKKLIAGDATLDGAGVKLIEAARVGGNNATVIRAIEVDDALTQIRSDAWRFLTTSDQKDADAF